MLDGTSDMGLGVTIKNTTFTIAAAKGELILKLDFFYCWVQVEETQQSLRSLQEQLKSHNLAKNLPHSFSKTRAQR